MSVYASEDERSLSVGSVGALDTTVKRRGRKHPIGFVPPAKRPAKRKPKARS